MTISRFGAIALAFMVGIAPAAAHRQPEVVTTIVHKIVDGTATSQITHRLHAHDAIKLLGRMSDAQSANLEAPENIDWLASYVAERFVPTTGSLQTLGGEVDGNYVFIYQEGEGRIAPESSHILADLSADWSNLIVIEGGEETWSITYTAAYPQGWTGQDDE
jgi:hypothetical protein